MNLHLAPIQGMTSAYYRNEYQRLFGSIDTYYTPFITTTEEHKWSSALLKDLLPENNRSSMSIIPQLLSNNGKDFDYYASSILDLGNKEINWNLGCPYPMVTKKKKGSGLLAYPEMIQTFLETVCPNNSYDLSIKMRLGLNNMEEGIKIITIINQYPIKNVTIHGRIGLQKYTGSVDLESFETIASLSKHPIIYNGDIFTVEDYRKIQSHFPFINDFMLGRGALRNPFLPSEIKGNLLSEDQKIKLLKDFHQSILNNYMEILSGETHVCDRMKEFWSYLSVYMDPSGKSMKKIKKVRNLSAYSAVINEIFHLYEA